MASQHQESDTENGQTRLTWEWNRSSITLFLHYQITFSCTFTATRSGAWADFISTSPIFTFCGGTAEHSMPSFTSSSIFQCPPPNHHIPCQASQTCHLCWLVAHITTFDIVHGGYLINLRKEVEGWVTRMVIPWSLSPPTIASSKRT